MDRHPLAVFSCRSPDQSLGVVSAPRPWAVSRGHLIRGDEVGGE